LDKEDVRLHDDNLLDASTIDKQTSGPST